MENSEINGYPLGKKREGGGCFIFENWYGLAPWKTRNQKI